MKRILLFIFGLFLFLVAGFFLGPRASFPVVDSTAVELDWAISDIDNMIAKKEAKIKNLKPDNQARIVWADSIPTKTTYSIVYLHGFSASQGEGFPMHLELAKKYKANLFLARLRDHGINDKDVFDDLTPGELINDAKEAIAIGKLIGEKVIVLSCSTGGTLSIYLAGDDPAIVAQILLSPNIALFDSNAKLMTGPWGLQITKQLVGDYNKLGGSSDFKSYWTTEYRVEGLIGLQALLDHTMRADVFKKITTPTFMGYYYEDEEKQDHQVSVSAMQSFYAQISTPEDLKKSISFPNAGRHVICSQYTNKNWKEVQQEIETFLEAKVLTYEL